ncbi:type III polyketide synthase [Emticicia oligotrophica]|uniref:type III polyketide synthase n=1 Tax=Emticicia oligotrophica TaxID=312279 RepID=UPI00273BAD1B|nr:type III polyketide synthase [Emticicia oligotrophica]
MSKIIAIGTANPVHRHQQNDIMRFMLDANNPDEKNRKLLPILYHRSGIDTRYSVFSDFSLARGQWAFFGDNCTMPSLEKRMAFYNQEAVKLSVSAIEDCLKTDKNATSIQEITHLITVTCTGLSAPGLDIQLVQALNLSPNIVRTSVNFMGCYAALHALKIADAFCRADASAKVLVVCTELCTLHFQKSNDVDAILSSTLFADGSAACLISGDNEARGLAIKQFYSQIALSGQEDMAWQLSSTGFLMTLSSHVPKLIKQEIKNLLENSLQKLGLNTENITDWAIHPGGKNILEAVETSLELEAEALNESYEVLKNYGNMSSPTILFVLKKMMESTKTGNIFAVAFGPGITMESVILER